MKKLKAFLSPRKLIWLLSIIILLVSISFVNQPSQSQTQGIVSSVAIDYEGEDIKVACAVLTPTSSAGKTSNMYSATSSTIAGAVELIGMQLGKDLGFAQCDVVAVGKNLLEKNVVDALDYFTRTKKVGRNVLLLGFEAKVEEFIKGIIYMEEKLSLTLSQILDYNQEYLLAIDSNLENFFLGYYGDSGISILPKIVMTDEPTEDGIKVTIATSVNSQTIGSVGLGGDGSSSNSNSQKEMYFINSGTTSVLKNGTLIHDFTPEDIKRLNLLLDKSKLGTFMVKNVSDNYYNNATVMLKMEDKRINLSYKMKDGKPILKAVLKVYVNVSEIIEEKKNEKLLRRIDALLTKTVQDKLKAQIADDMGLIFMKQKNLKADCMELYVNFNKYHYKEWQKYLNSLEDKDDYMQGIELDLKVQVAQNI